MHAFQRTSFHAVLLLSLGGIGCDLFQGDDEKENRTPTITQVSAASAAINEGTSTTLSVTASDPDGDPLTYSWTQLPAAPTGTFSDETGATRTWTAPLLASDTTFTLQVTVTDGKGGSSQATVDVAVANVATPNSAPSVAETITAPASVIAGDTADLSIVASDPDGDTLTYSWTTNPADQGTFTNPTAAAAQWRSSDIREATTYTFQVTVSDGTDSVTRSVNVRVDVPSYAAHIQPIWNAQCVRCHTGSPGRGGLTLDADKSYASIVNVGAAGRPCSPTGLMRVMPGKPDESLMVTKLGSAPLPCGSRMPTDNPTYFDEHPGELTRIRSWILAGALNN